MRKVLLTLDYWGNEDPDITGWKVIDNNEDIWYELCDLFGFDEDGFHDEDEGMFAIYGDAFNTDGWETFGESGGDWDDPTAYGLRLLTFEQFKEQKENEIKEIRSLLEEVRKEIEEEF